jgi:hypothetical protein
MEIEKNPEIPFSGNLSFFYLGGKEVFLLLQILWKTKKGLGQQF